METKTCDAAARRQARIRRILLNSEDRLRLIKGHNDIESIKDDEESSNGRISMHTSAPIVKEIIEDLPKAEPKHWHGPSVSDRPIYDVATSENNSAWSLNEENSLEAPQLQTSREQSLFSRLSKARVHIMLLAVVVRILLLYDLGFLFGDMVLLPLLLAKVSGSLVLPTAESSEGGGGLFGAVMVLSGLTRSKVHKILRLLCWLQEIARDLAFYLMAFLLMHALCQIMATPL